MNWWDSFHWIDWPAIWGFILPPLPWDLANVMRTWYKGGRLWGSYGWEAKTNKQKMFYLEKKKTQQIKESERAGANVILTIISLTNCPCDAHLNDSLTSKPLKNWNFIKVAEKLKKLLQARSALLEQRARLAGVSRVASKEQSGLCYRQRSFTIQ